MIAKYAQLLCAVFTLTAEVLFAQEDARILEQITHYTINTDGTAEIEEVKKIRINSDQGKYYGVYREYFDNFRKIEDLSIEVFDANGKRVKKYRKSDAHQVGFNSSYEISDARLLILVTDYQNYPYTMEITSKVKLNGFISLPTWMPCSQFRLGVEKATLVVKRPNEVKIRFRESNISGTMEADATNTTNTYFVSDLKAIPPKLSYKDFYDAQPKVFISPEKFELDKVPGSMASWTDFGDWFYTLNKGPFELTPKTKSLVDSLRNTDQKLFIRQLYQYMQDKTRYVSIQLGIGGFKSLPITDVERYGYGDCKALSTYMKSLLEYAGIKSNYVLVRAGQDVPDVLADFPSNQFNHVFLAVPLKSDTVLLECTSQNSPADFVGTFTDDRNVLWIDDGKSRIIRSRVYSHYQNHQQSNAYITLTENGDAMAEFHISNEGVFFDEIMLFQAAPKEYIENHNRSKFNYADFSLQSFTFSQPDRNTPIFHSKYNLGIKGLAKQASDKLILPAMPGMPFNKYLTTHELKKYSEIKRGFTLSDSIRVNLPEKIWIYNLPQPQEIKSRFGEYTQSFVADGNRLTIYRRLILYKGYYNKSDFDEFLRFYQKIESLEGKKLVLSAKT